MHIISRAIIPIALAMFQAVAFAGAAHSASRADILRASAEQLNTAHSQLAAMKTQMVELNRRFTENQRNNLAKLYVKGVLQIYDKVAAPGGWTDVVGQGYSYLESVVSGPPQQTVRTKKLSASETSQLREAAMQVLKGRGRIERYVSDFAKILKAPLERFDDDQPAMRSAKYWWRYERDGKKDDATKLTLRRGWVISGLSSKIVEVMERELANIRAQRKALLALADKLAAPAATGTAEKARPVNPDMSWESVERENERVRVFHVPRLRGQYIYEPKAQQSDVGSKICKALGGEYDTRSLRSYYYADTAVDMTGAVVCTEDCLVFAIIYCGGYK